MVIASNLYYTEFREQLISFGLQEFVDFLGYKYFIKKIAIINCNCYGYIYRNFLFHNPYFTREYTIYETPSILMENADKCIPDDILKRCGLLISQDVQKNNEVGEQFSLEYVRSRLPESARCVIVPNLVGVGKGFFPHLGDGEVRGRYDPDVFKTNHIIDYYRKQRVTVKEIIVYMKNTEYYSFEAILSSVLQGMNKIRNREKGWDVKITDYLVNNINSYMLFYDDKHPTELVFNEICRRLISYLGYPDSGFVSNVMYDGTQEFMLPSTLARLGIDVDQSFIRKEHNMRTLADGGISFEEYVKEYVYYCENM